MENSNKPTSKLRAIGIPLVFLALGLFFGAGHHSHGSNDWGGALMLMIGYPIIISVLAIATAIGASLKKAFGKYCAYALIFMVAQLIGRFFFSGHPF